MVEASSSGCWEGAGEGSRAGGCLGSASVFLLLFSATLLCHSNHHLGRRVPSGVSPGKGKGQSRTSLMPAYREQRISGLHIFGGSTQVGTNSPPPGRITQSPASPPSGQARMSSQPGGCSQAPAPPLQCGPRLPSQPGPGLSSSQIQPPSLWCFTPL